MVFVLDDNVYTDVVLPVECARHDKHGVRLILEHVDADTAREFLGMIRHVSVRCTEVHEHPMTRIQNSIVGDDG